MQDDNDDVKCYFNYYFLLIRVNNFNLITNIFIIPMPCNSILFSLADNTKIKTKKKKSKIDKVTLHAYVRTYVYDQHNTIDVHILSAVQ